MVLREVTKAKTTRVVQTNIFFPIRKVKVQLVPNLNIETPALSSEFCSMNRLGMFLFPLDGMLVDRGVTPIIKFASTHLYSWIERGTVRVTCLAQEHSTIFPAMLKHGPL